MTGFYCHIQAFAFTLVLKAQKFFVTLETFLLCEVTEALSL